MSQAARAKNDTREVQIPSGEVTPSGELNIPRDAAGVVLFAHGSGSSRRSPRNQFVARTICNAGVGTLLFDLLTRDEEPGTLDQVAHLAAEWFQTHLHSSKCDAKDQESAGEYVTVKR